MSLDEVEQGMAREAEAAAYLALFKQLHDAQKNGTICLLAKDDVPRVMQSFVESGKLRVLQRDLGIKYSASDGILELMGTKFSPEIFENFRTTTSEDECYHHVAGDAGQITLTREIGHRSFLRRMREVLEGSPCTCQRIVSISGPGPLVPPARCSRCEILAQTADSIAAEAMALHTLLEKVRAFRETTKADSDAPGWREQQLTTVGQVFGALEILDAIYAQQHTEKGSKLIVEPGAPA
jgi:hypothetical protein